MLSATELDTIQDALRGELGMALIKYGDQDSYCHELNRLIFKIDVMIAERVDAHEY
jgi:hypothetical protein